MSVRLGIFPTERIMFFGKKNKKGKGGDDHQILKESSHIDLKPMWNGKFFSFQIKGPGALCQFQVDRGIKSLYFTLDDVLFLKRFHECFYFQASKILLPLVKFSGIPFDECIVSFLRQGTCQSRIAAKQVQVNYCISDREFYPFGKDQFGCGWVIELSNHNDWWSHKNSRNIINELQ